MHKLFYNNRNFEVPTDVRDRVIRIQFFGKTVELKPNEEEGYNESWIHTPLHFHWEVRINNLYQLIREQEWTPITLPAFFADGVETTMTIYVKKTKQEELDWLCMMKEKLTEVVRRRWLGSAVHAFGLTGPDAVMDSLDRRELDRLDKEIEKRR